VRKIHPRDEVTEQAAGEDRDVEVRRLHRPVRRRDCAGLRGYEVEGALRVGASASEPGPRLPDFQQRVRDRFTLAVEDLALDSHRACRSRERELLALLEG